MIIAQILLILILIAAMVYLLMYRGTSKTKAYKKLGLVVFTVVAIFSVLVPEMLNWLAHGIGIGRGADLLLYGTVVAFIFMLMNNYLKEKHDERRFVKLARKVALLEYELQQVQQQKATKAAPASKQRKKQAKK